MKLPDGLVKNLTIILIDNETGEIIKAISDGVKDGITIICKNAGTFLKLVSKLILK